MVCEGTPVMSMVSLVASHGSSVRTHGADDIFLGGKLCILLYMFDEGFFSKDLHDRQNKQPTFLLNKIFSLLIFLLLVFFTLSNCLTQKISFSLVIILTWKISKQGGESANYFSKMVNHSQTYQQTDLHLYRIWYIYIFLLLMSSFNGVKLMP